MQINYIHWWHAVNVMGLITILIFLVLFIQSKTCSTDKHIHLDVRGANKAFNFLYARSLQDCSGFQVKAQHYFVCDCLPGQPSDTHQYPLSETKSDIIGIFPTATPYLKLTIYSLCCLCVQLFCMTSISLFCLHKIKARELLWDNNV